MLLTSKSFAIDLIMILSGFVCHIASVSLQPEAPSNQRQQQLTTSAINFTTSSEQSIESMPNFYTNSQAIKFRVNVSNICEKNHMRVTVRLSRPFYGLIHTKDKRKKPACQVEGTGEQTYVMEISYTLVQSDPTYCGIVAHQATQALNQSLTSNLQQTLSVALVVRLHKTIEFSDDRYFLLSCANRCARFDCSTGSESSNGHLTTSTRHGGSRGISASESIVAPVLRPNEPPPSGSSGRSVELATNGWTTTERCDYLLDLKFQWLAKICWALVILLMAMFCTSYCLCLALNKNKSGKSKQPVSANRRASRSRPSSSSTREILYPTQSSLNLSGESHLSAPSSWSAGAQVAEAELNKIRDDNVYLGEQHQELMLADLLAKSAQTIDRKQQHRPQVEPQQIMVLGRSAAPFNTLTNQNHNEPLEVRVKRRRSIGSSMAVAAPFESQRNIQQASDWHRGGKLDASQRAKSRSQTTIHYEQGQDPFKAVPFSYLNNGYISDGAASQRVYLGSGSGAVDVYGITPQSHQVAMDAQQFAMPTPKSQAPQLSSQFDPQNSRQLIDLIQHKHRQQMAQADQTAAIMQEVQRRPPPVVQPRSWR